MKDVSKFSPKAELAVIIPKTPRTEKYHDVSIFPSISSSPLSSAPSSPNFPTMVILQTSEESESDYERTHHLSRRASVARAKSLPCDRKTRRHTFSTPSNTLSGFLMTLGYPSAASSGTARDVQSEYQERLLSTRQSRLRRCKSLGPTSEARRNVTSSPSARFADKSHLSSPTQPKDQKQGKSRSKRSQPESRSSRSIPAASTQRQRCPSRSKSSASARRSRRESTSSLSSAPSRPEFPSCKNQSSFSSNSESDYERSGYEFSKRAHPRSKSVPPRTTTSQSPKNLLTRSSTISPYFPPTPTKTPTKKTEKISCIPFPPLASQAFGLVQESLAQNPFRLLIAVLFLNKTRGSVAMPVYHALMTRYPTPTALAAADHSDIVSIIQHLGLQNQRARKCIAIAKTWLTQPPEKGKRYRRLHYPKRGDGKDIDINEGWIGDEDERVAWEVGHLPGIGAYAIDSWRIFCRDDLRDLATGLPSPCEQRETSEPSSEAAKLSSAKTEPTATLLNLPPEYLALELQKEWTRVLPLDKELRAYLRWRWLRLGWQWDPLTGNRQPVTENLLNRVKEGGVSLEGEEGRWELRELEGGGAVEGEEETGVEEESDEQDEEWMFTPESWRLRVQEV